MVKIIASTDAVYNNNYIFDFEDMIAAHKSLLPVFLIISLQRRATLTLALSPFHDVFYNNTLIESSTRPPIVSRE